MVLVLAACGQASITSGAPYSSGTRDVVDVAVDFFQDHDRVGKLYIRTREAHGNLVRFLIEVPIVADSDYRLDTVDFEFMSDLIQPLIMLEPSGGTLTQDISFTRVGSMVRLSVPDTGQHGDGTVLFNFLAEKEVFAGHGLWLHAELGFGAGDAVADLLIEPAFTATPAAEAASAEIGVRYTHNLYTHCGVRYADFDGRRWLADPVLTANEGLSPPPGWGNPNDLGTMELVSKDRALFLSHSGDKAIFKPAPEDYTFKLCM